MSNKDINENTEKETPVMLPVGVLLTCFSSIPLIFGLTQSEVSVTIAGGIFILMGIILTIAGYVQNKKLNK
ncbi:MAG TPA: hypothetical protein PLO89_08705 [Spirochaetota bacterium]|nr:hypothetical protein [Spirochaetota bacterium]